MTNFPFYCKGRDENGKEALPVSVMVYLQIEQEAMLGPYAGSIFRLSVKCPHAVGDTPSTGKKNHRCSAKVPDGKGVFCPYVQNLGETREFSGYNYEDYVSTRNEDNQA